MRGALQSIPKGQTEAARAMGLTPFQIFRLVVLPQALRVIIPPLGNDMINLLKATSLVSVVGVGDLMTRAQGIYASNYQVIPLLIVASIWYLVLTIVDEPKMEGSQRSVTAGFSAAPLAGNIIKRSALMLGVAPRFDEPTTSTAQR